jgi:hypothetical protein
MKRKASHRSTKAERIYARWFRVKPRKSRTGVLTFRADGKRTDRYRANWNKRELSQNIRKLYRKKTARRISVHGLVTMHMEDGTSMEMSFHGVDLSFWKSKGLTTQEIEDELHHQMKFRMKEKESKYGSNFSNWGALRWQVTVSHT